MILITGATGTAGRELCKILNTWHVPFRVLVRRQADLEQLEAQGIQAMPGDLTQPDSVRQALQGIDRVYLLSPSNPQQPELEHAFVIEARDAGIRHIVKHSVIGASKSSGCAFLRWHACSEEMVEQSGIPYTFLRLNGFMQNIVPLFAHSVKNEGIMYAPLQEARVSYVNASDIAEVAAHILTEEEHAGKIYTITGPEAITNTQIASKLSSLLHRPVIYVNITDEVAYKTMRSAGLPSWSADALISLYRFYRAGGGAVVTQEIKQIAGHSAHTIDTYLAENIQEFKNSWT